MVGSVIDPDASEEQAELGARDDRLREQFSKWNKDCDAHWSDWRKEAKEAYDMYAGRQWVKEAEDALKDADRVAVTINRVATIIDAVSGAEVLGRQQAAYFPREVGDSAVNEVLTKGAEWVRDQTDADFEESEAVRDAFICGMGWTETRMDYEEEPEGKILIQRVDPLELCADPSHRQPGCLDGRYLRRRKPMAEDDFERLFPGKTGVASADNTSTRSVRPGHRYEDADGEVMAEDEVIVCEWQWYEVETVALTAGPDGALQTIEAEEADELEKTGAKVVRIPRRRYYRAFTSGEEILQVDDLADGEFTYKCITGKRDRNKRVWFGLMRLMRDPQRFANSFFTQILHIIQTSSKGGVYAEDGAIEDIRQFEESLAKSDKITWVPQNALTSGKIQPKPVTPYPAGLERLMDMAISAIRDSTGVNQELLGLVEREQAGIVEDQRRQAAYGILAAFFDSLRRYRKGQGGLLLKLMRYLPKDTLVRIVGNDGTARYVPLAMDPNTAKFDVIVDEAPTGPRQKEKVWSTVMQLQGVLKDLGPEEWGLLLEYSPFPAAIVQQFKQLQERKSQTPPDPAAEAGKAAALAEQQGKARKVTAEAAKTEVETAQMARVFGPPPGLGGAPMDAMVAPVPPAGELGF